MPGLWGEALHNGDGMLDGLGLGETGGVVAGGVAPAAAAAAAVGAATDTASTRGQVNLAANLSCIVDKAKWTRRFAFKIFFLSTLIACRF